MPHLSGHWKIKKNKHSNCKCRKKPIKQEEEKVAINVKIPLKNTEKIQNAGSVLKPQNYKINRPKTKL